MDGMYLSVCIFAKLNYSKMEKYSKMENFIDSLVDSSLPLAQQSVVLTSEMSLLGGSSGTTTVSNDGCKNSVASACALTNSGCINYGNACVDSTNISCSNKPILTNFETSCVS